MQRPLLTEMERPRLRRQMKAVPAVRAWQGFWASWLGLLLAQQGFWGLLCVAWAPWWCPWTQRVRRKQWEPPLKAMRRACQQGWPSPRQACQRLQHPATHHRLAPLRSCQRHHHTQLWLRFRGSLLRLRLARSRRWARLCCTPPARLCTLPCGVRTALRQAVPFAGATLSGKIREASAQLEVSSQSAS